MESDTNVDKHPETSETLVCLQHICAEDDDQYKLECKECRRLVHYRCTELPLYQIERFLTKGYSRFICISCVSVSEYLKDIVPNSPLPEQINVSTMTTLTNAPKLTTEKNENHKLENLALVNNQKQVISDLDDQIDATKHFKEEVTKLKSEIQQYENSLKDHEEVEANLNAIIVTQKTELREQEEKFHEVGNPDYDALTILEGLVNTKLEAVGRTLKESILKEVNENNNEFNKKLEQVVNQNRTYAESVKNTPPSGETPRIPNETTDLRIIMKEARNEELAEESEKKQRACNIIVHGIEEWSSTDIEEAKEGDREFVKSLIGALRLSTTYKGCLRIGKADPTKKRPIKVVFNTEAEKNKIMENLKELKGQEKFRGMSITDDYTLAERQIIKEYSDKAKDYNNKEPQDSDYVWRVRGSPKNGLRLKKFQKQGVVVVKQLI